jgi:hypothetical protein
MFEFNGVFINPYEVASAHIETQLGRFFLTLTLSSGESFREVYDDRTEALSIINELSEIINPADFYEEDEDEEWL